MEFRSGTEGYYRQMLELTDKLRKSEEERLKLEEKFNEIMQQSRDAENERLRIMRHKYHKFLEEDKVRQARNENILRTLDRIENRAKQLAVKTDRFKAFRKQYLENYLKQIPKPKQQTFDLNTQSTNRPQYQNESVCRQLFSSEPKSTVNENVEKKLALLEKYLRDNFDNFPQDFAASTIKLNGVSDGKQTNVLYDNKNYLDNASDSKESQEIEVEKYSPIGFSHHQKASELLGNRIEQELDRLWNKKENELNNNSLNVQETIAEQVVNDYKKLVSKSEEKYGLKYDLQNGISKRTEVFDSTNNVAPIDGAYKLSMDAPYNVDDKKESNLKLELSQEEENSEDTKPPTDISLNLSTSSQLKEQFDVFKEDKLPEINNEEYLENSSKSEEITSIEKQKVQPFIQRKKSNVTETKPISSQSDEIVKTQEVSNEEKIEQQNVGIHYSQDNINNNEQYIENPQSNEFGESVSEQQNSKEQNYRPEIYSEKNQEVEQNYYEQQYTVLQNEIQEQYKDEMQSNYEQDDANIMLQDDKKEIYNVPQYEKPDQQYDNPEQQNGDPEPQYENSEQQFQNPDQFEASENQYLQSEQQYESPEKQYNDPGQQYNAPEKQHEVPELQYNAPEIQHEVLEQQCNGPKQQYEVHEQQYKVPEQQYEVSEKQYNAPEQQHEILEQQYNNPEQQYMKPQQQEYSPENYDQQYSQQTYPEEEYNHQNYSQVYETQQQENYDTQNYPEQQYPEGYDMQQYTEEEQLKYDQPYPQAESYLDQQFVENTGKYDPQGQYSENIYQTGQEYLEGEQNIDHQYETEQDYPDSYVGQEIEKNVKDGQVKETVNITEDNEIAAISEQQLQANKPLVQKKLPNLADMLDTDTSESVKPDSKITDSDFDLSNTKT